MKLLSLLDDRLVLWKAKTTTLDSMVEHMLDKLYQYEDVSASRKQVTELLNARKALGGMVFETGLAIPHARIPGLRDLWILPGVPAEPFWENEVEVRLVVLFLVPAEVSEYYLPVLSYLTRLSRDNDVFSQWIGQPTRDAFIDYTQKFQLKTSLEVRDIMSPEVISVNPEMKLREVADLLYKYSISYLPVLDKDGRLVGEITLHDIIRVGLPNYAFLVGDLGFMQSFEPFEHLIKNEDSILVADTMAKPGPHLAPDEKIFEAALEFAKTNRRQIPVLENKTLVGVLSITDLLKKVIRA
ncbi:CBS domain-containing protein [Spirochaeta lutea]|uniref:Uncharacterized protein n=1 Tax=Spirochaeta lutea TaxID=1480694 RepID=A0A098QSN8_9SPIO|nr:CBS domain-containing protein [Spirochaeta lutea]KGE70855.1 hypothetical protein DC28_15415 [Spirochaeta lutea]